MKKGLVILSLTAILGLAACGGNGGSSSSSSSSAPTVSSEAPVVTSEVTPGVSSSEDPISETGEPAHSSEHEVISEEVTSAIATSEIPAETSEEKPVESSVEPIVTSEAPIVTSEAPVASSEAPVVTSEELDPGPIEPGYNPSEKEVALLGEYNKLYREANAITDPSRTAERYAKFAEAEYNLIYETAVMVPWLAQNGTSASVARTVPWQAGRASYGLTGDKFKNVVVSSEVTTKERRNTITEIYEEGKSKDVSHAPDADGWISLANENANPAIVDGRYTVANADGSKSVTVPVKNELKTTYTKEPERSFLNYLTNTWTYNSYHYCNMVDGLVENDKYGNIVGALADKYKVTDNADGTETWTFHIREDATWVENASGAKYADVVADDFVAAAEWVLNAGNAAGASNLMTAFVKGAMEYNTLTADPEAEVDFDEIVGIKAVDDHTIEYTLNEVTPYFITVLTYSPYLPVNRAFLDIEGAEFGISENHLLVNGAFRITEHEDQSKMVYTKNASYYDAEHVYLDKVTRNFITGAADPSFTRTLYEAGTIDSFTVSSDDEEGWARYITGPEGTGTQKNPYSEECNPITSYGSSTYFGYFNYNRDYFEYTDTANTKSDADKALSEAAIMNKSFRKAFLYGLNVIEQLKRYAPASPHDWCYRAYTNRELAAAGGMDYADYVDAVYNRENGLEGEDKVTLTGIDNGSDPIYNADKAKELFREAKAALLKQGFTESDFPIKIDTIGDMNVKRLAYEQAMYRSINENSEGLVQVQLNIPGSDAQDTEWGSMYNNFDFSMWSGWGPDYADPNTFLHTLCIGGDMVEYLGFSSVVE